MTGVKLKQEQHFLIPLTCKFHEILGGTEPLRGETHLPGLYADKPVSVKI